MAIPEVTCNADQVISYGSAQVIQLTCTATESPISFRWELKSAPSGSTAFAETRSDFINGVATIQNPQFTTDINVEGTYCFECVATNATGDSLPSVDKENSQQNIVVRTELYQLTLPNDYQWRWGDYNTNNFLTLEALTGIATSIKETSGPTTLTFGSISDGQTLSRSGTTVVGITPTGSDELVKVTGADTTAEVLNDKILVANGLSKSTSDKGSGNLAIQFEPTYGSSSNTICEGNDSRLSDSRTPLSHSIGGTEHSSDTLANFNLKISDATLIDTTDSRLSDDRTPTSHASTHISGGGDSIKLDDLATPDDNTDLDATTLIHGLLPKLGGGTTNFLRADGTWATPAGGGSAINLWRYLDGTNLPTGAISPEAVWQFDATGNELNDRTANSHNLTEVGSSRSHAAAEGLVGVAGYNDFYFSIANASSIVTDGAYTLEVLASLSENERTVFLATDGANSSTDTTVRYYISWQENDHKLQQQHFNNSPGTWQVAEHLARPTVGPIQCFTFTRSSDGLTYKVYADGQLLDSQTVSFAPNSGVGTVNPYLFLGAGVNRFVGAVFCMRFTKEEWSASQVLEAYEYVRRLS